MARTAWAKARDRFVVSVPRAMAIKRIRTYASEHGVDPAPAIAAVTGPLRFVALSLDAGGTPIACMHSDDSFTLLFGTPTAEQLDDITRTIATPFPAGLMTPLGMVVANPAMLENKKKRELFKPDRYHGAVMWSWQQAMTAAGLARQRQRTDLPEATQARLAGTEAALWKVIQSTDEHATGETWSWKVRDGRWEVYRLGEFAADDEATAAQLWSTVYLAVRPPAP
jgi:hypothetical protein